MISPFPSQKKAFRKKGSSLFPPTKMVPQLETKSSAEKARNADATFPPLNRLSRRESGTHSSTYRASPSPPPPLPPPSTPHPHKNRPSHRPSPSPSPSHSFSRRTPDQRCPKHSKRPLRPNRTPLPRQLPVRVGREDDDDGGRANRGDFGGDEGGEGAGGYYCDFGREGGAGYGDAVEGEEGG